MDWIGGELEEEEEFELIEIGEFSSSRFGEAEEEPREPRREKWNSSDIENEREFENFEISRNQWMNEWNEKE